MNSEWQSLPPQTQQELKNTMNAMQPPQSVEEVKATWKPPRKAVSARAYGTAWTVFQRDPESHGAIAYNILTDRKDIIAHRFSQRKHSPDRYRHEVSASYLEKPWADQEKDQTAIWDCGE